MTLALIRSPETGRSLVWTPEVLRVALLALIMNAALGCTAVDQAPAILDSDQGYSCLYRAQLEVDGPNPQWRMTLRLRSPSDFQLSATGPFGKKLWTLVVEEEHALWLDHREKRYCRVSSQATASLLPRALDIRLPWRSVPAVLRGRAPVGAPDPAANGKTSYLDDHGQLWVVRWENHAPTAWTLSLDGAPLLSWSGDSVAGRLLDEGSGAELRWQLVRCEQGPVPPLRPEPDGDMVEWICHEEDLSQFRQDQSPSAGDGRP